MTTLSTKPDDYKTFFQNYAAHKKFIELKHSKMLDEYRLKQGSEKLSFIVQQIAAHMTIFETLWDRYDYVDELLGATALPLLFTGFAIQQLGLAAWEGIQALAEQFNLKEKDGNEHSFQALGCLQASVASVLIAVFSLVKSTISLITRPLATLALDVGNPKAEQERFVTDQEEPAQLRV